VSEAHDLHSDYSMFEAQIARPTIRGWIAILAAAREGVVLFSVLCAYWVAMRIADGWLKFRAAIADRRARWRVVPDRNGVVKAYTDLELKIRTGGDYGGQRAVFITELAAMEDELLKLREADAAMRREEAGRTANRRHEAVAATKEKLKVETQHGCNR
jgi:hypothetical protein